MKKMLFIMNPCSGKKRANRYLTDIISIFNRGGYDVTVYITDKQGDATEKAKEMAPEVDLVVCCGGDGTFNETICGVLAAGVDVPLGYIPAGSTNDFANSLNLPTSVLEAARHIVEGEPVAFDAGLFQDRYFSYVASFGAFTHASYATPQNVKNTLGHTAYLPSGISELGQIRKIPAKFDMDGDVVEGEFIFGAICNSTSVGGVLTLDPKQVDMQDGLFEVLLVRNPKNLGEITECIAAFQNKTYNCKMVSFRSAKHVKVTMENPVDWTLDGERQEGMQELEATNCHLAIRLMVKGN